MAFLIDADIIIGYERNKNNFLSFIKKYTQEECFISVITTSELMHGVWRASTPTIRSKRTAFVESILNAMPIIDIDLSIAREHARIWAELSSKGHMIGIHDLWIAATCIIHNLTLFTGNLREFKKIVGLRIESLPFR